MQSEYADQSCLVKGLCPGDDTEPTTNRLHDGAQGLGGLLEDSVTPDSLLPPGTFEAIARSIHGASPPPTQSWSILIGHAGPETGLIQTCRLNGRQKSADHPAAVDTLTRSMPETPTKPVTFDSSTCTAHIRAGSCR